MTHDGDYAWRAQAKCRGADITHFYPRTVEGRADAYEKARAVCATCPVQPQCLEDALRTEDFLGVRAGLTPPQLEVLARRRQHIRRHAYASTA